MVSAKKAQLHLIRRNGFTSLHLVRKVRTVIGRIGDQHKLGSLPRLNKARSGCHLKLVICRALWRCGEPIFLDIFNFHARVQCYRL